MWWLIFFSCAFAMDCMLYREYCRDFDGELTILSLYSSGRTEQGLTQWCFIFSPFQMDSKKIAVFLMWLMAIKHSQCLILQDMRIYCSCNAGVISSIKSGGKRVLNHFFPYRWSGSVKGAHSVTYLERWMSSNFKVSRMNCDLFIFLKYLFFYIPQILFLKFQ